MIEATSPTTTVARPPIPSFGRRIVLAVRDLGYLLAGLPLGVVGFAVALTGLALAAGLAITLIGIPILLATLLAARGFAALERRRAGVVLRDRIRGRERGLGGGLLARSRTAAGDPASWRDTAWALALLPVGTFGATVALALWTTTLGLISSPLWYWALPDDDDVTIPLIDDVGVPYSVLRVLIGLALLPATYAICRGLSEGTARMARALLG